MSVTQTPPDAPAPRASDGEDPPSIKKRAIRGSVWTTLAFAGNQLLRFGANLVLTRLLFPEAFATMVIVNTFIMGLHLFSDVGIIPSIVQNKRGDDRDFLNTAWTIQVFRGFALWLAACALAYPVSRVYGDYADLALFIPVASLTAILDGFCSTKLYVLQRHIALGKVAALEFATQVFAVTVMVTWAFLYPTIWALVGGAIAGELFRTLASHRLPGTRNRLHWDPAIARELFHFGKWVFFATLLTFLAEQSDRLIFGKLVEDSMLGVYHIALMLALIVPHAIDGLVQTVLFPSFSRMLDEDEDFRPGLSKARKLASGLGGWVVAGMIAAGPATVAVLYDARYADAGWMIQLLAITAWLLVLECSTGAALLALGKVKLRATANLAKVLGLVTLLPLGFHLAGFPGALLGLASAQLLKYAVATAGARSCGLPVLLADARLTVWVAASGLAVLGIVEWFDGPSLPSAALAITATTLAWAPWGHAMWRQQRRSGAAATMPT